MITHRKKSRTYTPSFAEGSLRYIDGYKRDLDILINMIRSNTVEYKTPAIKLLGIDLKKDAPMIVERIDKISSKRLEKGIRSEVEACLQKFEEVSDRLTTIDGFKAVEAIVHNSSLNKKDDSAIEASKAVLTFYERFLVKSFLQIKDLPFVFFKFALKFEFELLSSQLIPLESPINKNRLNQDQAHIFVEKKHAYFQQSFESAIQYPLEQFEYQIDRLKTGSLNIAESDPSVERFQSSVIKKLEIPKKGEKKIISTDQFAALRDFDMAFFRFTSKNKMDLGEQNQEDLGSLVRVLLKTGGGKSYLSNIISLYVENFVSQGISRIINIKPQSSESEFEQLRIENLENLKGTVVQLDEFHFYANFPSFYQDVELTQEEISASEGDEFKQNQIKVYKKLKMMTQAGAIVITYGASESLEKLNFELEETTKDLEKEQERLSKIDKTQLESMKSFLTANDYQSYLNWANNTQINLTKAYKEIVCSTSKGKYQEDYLLASVANLSKMTPLQRSDFFRTVNSSIESINNFYRRDKEIAQYFVSIFNYYLDDFEERRSDRSGKSKIKFKGNTKTDESRRVNISLHDKALLEDFIKKVRLFKDLCELDPLKLYETYNYNNTAPISSKIILNNFNNFPIINQLQTLGARYWTSSYDDEKRKLNDFQNYQKVLNLLKAFPKLLEDLPTELVERIQIIERSVAKILSNDPKQSNIQVKQNKISLSRLNPTHASGSLRINLGQKEKYQLLPVIRLNIFHLINSDQVRAYFIESESRSYSRILTSKKSLLSNYIFDLQLRRDEETSQKFNNSNPQKIEYAADKGPLPLLDHITNQIPKDLQNIAAKKIRKIQLVLPFIDLRDFSQDRMQDWCKSLGKSPVSWVIYTDSNKKVRAISTRELTSNDDQTDKSESTLTAGEADNGELISTDNIDELFLKLMDASEPSNVVMLYDRNNSIGGDYKDFSVDVDLAYLAIDSDKPISMNQLMQWYGRNRNVQGNPNSTTHSFYYGKSSLDFQPISDRTVLEDLVHAASYSISGLSQYQYNQSNKLAQEYVSNKDQIKLQDESVFKQFGDENERENSENRQSHDEKLIQGQESLQNSVMQEEDENEQSTVNENNEEMLKNRIDHNRELLNRHLGVIKPLYETLYQTLERLKLHETKNIYIDSRQYSIRKEKDAHYLIMPFGFSTIYHLKKATTEQDFNSMNEGGGYLRYTPREQEVIMTLNGKYVSGFINLGELKPQTITKGQQEEDLRKKQVKEVELYENFLRKLIQKVETIYKQQNPETQRTAEVSQEIPEVVASDHNSIANISVRNRNMNFRSSISERSLQLAQSREVNPSDNVEISNPREIALRLIRANLWTISNMVSRKLQRPKTSLNNANLALTGDDKDNLNYIKSNYIFHYPESVSFYQQGKNITIEVENGSRPLEIVIEKKDYYYSEEEGDFLDKNAHPHTVVNLTRSKILSEISKIFKLDKQRYSELNSQVQNKWSELQRLRAGSTQNKQSRHLDSSEEIHINLPNGEHYKFLSGAVYKIDGKEENFVKYPELESLDNKIDNYVSNYADNLTANRQRLDQIQRLKQDIDPLNQTNTTDYPISRIVEESRQFLGFPEYAEKLDVIIRSLETEAKGIRESLEKEISELIKGISDLQNPDSVKTEQNETKEEETSHQEIPNLLELSEKKEALARIFKELQNERKRIEELEENKRQFIDAITTISSELSEDNHPIDKDRLVNENLEKLQEILDEIQDRANQIKDELILSILQTSELVFDDKSVVKKINLPDKDAADNEIDLTDESLRNLSLSELRAISKSLSDKEQSLKEEEIKSIGKLDYLIAFSAQKGRNFDGSRNKLIYSKTETDGKNLGELRELSKNLTKNLNDITESRHAFIINLLREVNDIFSIENLTQYFTSPNSNEVSIGISGSLRHEDSIKIEVELSPYHCTAYIKEEEVYHSSPQLDKNDTSFSLIISQRENQEAKYNRIPQNKDLLDQLAKEISEKLTNAKSCLNSELLKSIKAAFGKSIAKEIKIGNETVRRKNPDTYEFKSQPEQHEGTILRFSTKNISGQEAICEIKKIEREGEKEREIYYPAFEILKICQTFAKHLQIFVNNQQKGSYSQQNNRSSSSIASSFESSILTSNQSLKTLDYTYNLMRPKSFVSSTTVSQIVSGNQVGEEAKNGSGRDGSGR